MARTIGSGHGRSKLGQPNPRALPGRARVFLPAVANNLRLGFGSLGAWRDIDSFNPNVVGAARFRKNP